MDIPHAHLSLRLEWELRHTTASCLLVRSSCEDKHGQERGSRTQPAVQAALSVRAGLEAWWCSLPSFATNCPSREMGSLITKHSNLSCGSKKVHTIRTLCLPFLSPARSGISITAMLRCTAKGNFSVHRSWACLPCRVQTLNLQRRANRSDRLGHSRLRLVKFIAIGLSA